VINERLTYLAPERLLTLEAATSHADRRKIPGDYLEMGLLSAAARSCWRPGCAATGASRV
jgi:hypothetical protein